MLNAAFVTASFIGLACVIVAIWRKDLYRQAMLGWSLSLLAMGTGQLLLAAGQHSVLSARVFSGALWIVGGALLAGSLLRQGRRPPTCARKDSAP